jgi:anthranilate phosphoribosyltransferase
MEFGCVLSQYNMMLLRLLDAVHAVVDTGRDLTAGEAEQAMSIILRGEATPVEIAAFLIGLRGKGETAEELTGFARAMRAAAEPVDIEGPLLDTCGTGGGGIPTFNISTAAAFVVAGAGVRVAKHGNRSISSRCGSADVLESLGVDFSRPVEAVRDSGIGFFFAPAFHPAMRHVQPVRRELKMRTVFNMLGPLANPARANAQVVGTFSRRSAGLIANALASLGLERGFVVHGEDGLDEATTTAATTVFSIENGRVEEGAYQPEDFGVPRANLEDLAGGDATENAAILREVLSGVAGPRRDIVLANAALGLVAASRAATLLDAMRLAAESIDSGAAMAKLQALTGRTLVR